MTPQELNEVQVRAEAGIKSDDPAMQQLGADMLTLMPEFRRLRDVEGKTRLFAYIVPPCDCGAYENKTKPCSANCRIDRDFRTILFGDFQVSP